MARIPPACCDAPYAADLTVNMQETMHYNYGLWYRFPIGFIEICMKYRYRNVYSMKYLRGRS
jgi:hypothetical protein